ncbi:acyltransferase domain-containing protein [Streptomyces sp. NPDC057137]|uniref:acyltransferase domain-containing protein n=1 Tax=Streptomyces sp. NPDC057137 TaxID=3346030 RepID=UPI00363C907F
MTTTAYLFPGQGVQRPGMGEGLFQRFPDLVAEADALLGYSVERLCLDPAGDRLTQTLYSQPAVYLVNALGYRARLADGTPAPDVVLGHSLGEYNALEAAGVVDFTVGMALVQARARATADVAGAMLAVLGLTRTRISGVLEQANLSGVETVNLNSDLQTVLAGPTGEIAAARPLLRAAGAKLAVRLNVSGPFHSRLMTPCVPAFAAAVPYALLRPPRIPVIANTTARPHTVGRTGQLLVQHLTRPVRWQESVEWLLDTYHRVDFVEVGNADILLTLVRHIERDRNCRLTELTEGPAMPRLTLDDLSAFLNESTDDDILVHLTEADLDTAFAGLGVDSLSIVELSSRLGTAFGMPEPDDVLEDLRTPRRSLDFVNRRPFDGFAKKAS